MVLTLFMMRILTSGYISMSRFARIWVAPWMSATPAWMRITSSWASAAAPAVPDPDLAPVLAVQVALVVPAAVLVVPVADLAQVVLLRDRAVHPVLVAHLLRMERLMVTEMRRYLAWW